MWNFSSFKKGLGRILLGCGFLVVAGAANAENIVIDKDYPGLRLEDGVYHFDGDLTGDNITVRILDFFHLHGSMNASGAVILRSSLTTVDGFIHTTSAIRGDGDLKVKEGAHSGGPLEIKGSVSAGQISALSIKTSSFIYAGGDIEVRSFILAKKSLRAGGVISTGDHIFAKNITANGGISSKGAITSRGRILSRQGHISAQKYINTQGQISAPEGNIIAGEYISASQYIGAGGDIQARFGVLSHWSIGCGGTLKTEKLVAGVQVTGLLDDHHRTVTCGKIEAKQVVNAILVETGNPPKK